MDLLIIKKKIYIHIFLILEKIDRYHVDIEHLRTTRMNGREGKEKGRKGREESKQHFVT